MKFPASAPSSAAAEEAALWAARLDGDSLDDARRAELDAWLARDPRHRALLSGYCQFSADLEAQLPALVGEGRVTMPSLPVPTRRRPGPLWWSGLGLAAAAAVALAVWIAQPAAEVQNLATAVAQRGTHVLADGTRVELNARTSLRFEHTSTARHVQLGDGEALFTVAKDATRPFTVTTPAGTVRVTGTTFSVRNDPAAAVALEVLVVEGSVQVRPSATTAG
ncbi:MAG: FecR domain-containing protein, partial [Opitutaceae bacterium]|nr:FecR domain-containing protein [Opitutaceae bacterium]